MNLEQLCADTHSVPESPFTKGDNNGKFIIQNSLFPDDEYHESLDSQLNSFLKEEDYENFLIQPNFLCMGECYENFKVLQTQSSLTFFGSDLSPPGSTSQDRNAYSHLGNDISTSTQIGPYSQCSRFHTGCDLTGSQEQRGSTRFDSMLGGGEVDKADIDSLPLSLPVEASLELTKRRDALHLMESTAFDDIGMDNAELQNVNPDLIDITSFSNGSISHPSYVA